MRDYRETEYGSLEKILSVVKGLILEVYCDPWLRQQQEREAPEEFRNPAVRGHERHQPLFLSLPGPQWQFIISEEYETSAEA